MSRGSQALRLSTPLLQRILPSDVAVAEVFGHLPAAVLEPEEEQYIFGAIDKRRREFATGRACARAALARLGVPPLPILRCPQGAPRWPTGIVGSITHCVGYGASAVARAADLASIGIDAEPDCPLPDGVLEMIASDEERALLPSSTHVCWDRLMFCAKEAVYKTWFPLTGSWLGFEEASITIEPGASAFRACLTKSCHVNSRVLNRFTGRWLACDGLILAAIVVSA